MGISPSGLSIGAGISQGLVDGMKLAIQTKQVQQDEAIKKQLANAQGLEAATHLYDFGGITPETKQMVSSFGLGNDNSQPQGGDNNQPKGLLASSGSSQTSSSQSPSQGGNGLSLASFNPSGSSSQSGNPPQSAPDFTHMGRIERGITADIYKKKLESQLPQAQAELQNTLYGGRSANTAMANQYQGEKAVQNARGSQGAMQQMIDNYKNPSPQGDASLVLNAFKIKFPNAPDVNSIEELTKSQSVPDTWKNKANQALEGGFTQDTRDNLMRDGISTFRANVQGLRATQNKYQGRLSQAGVNDPTITAENAVDDTYKQAQSLQKKIGGYVPPSQRNEGFLSQWVPKGLLGGESSVAKTPQQDNQAIQWARQNSKDPRAAKILQMNGVK